jgi:hypothetical protein
MLLFLSLFVVLFAALLLSRLAEAYIAAAINRRRAKTFADRMVEALEKAQRLEREEPSNRGEAN